MVCVWIRQKNTGALITPKIEIVPRPGHTQAHTETQCLGDICLWYSSDDGTKVEPLVKGNWRICLAQWQRPGVSMIRNRGSSSSMNKKEKECKDARES